MSRRDESCPKGCSSPAPLSLQEPVTACNSPQGLWWDGRGARSTPSPLPAKKDCMELCNLQLLEEKCHTWPGGRRASSTCMLPQPREHAPTCMGTPGIAELTYHHPAQKNSQRGSAPALQLSSSPSQVQRDVCIELHGLGLPHYLNPRRGMDSQSQ